MKCRNPAIGWILISAYYCVTQIPGRSRTFHLWPGQLSPALPSPLLCPNHHRCADPVLKLHVGAVPGCALGTAAISAQFRASWRCVPTVVLYRRAVLLGVWILVSCFSCQGAPGCSQFGLLRGKQLSAYKWSVSQPCRTIQDAHFQSATSLPGTLPRQDTLEPSLSPPGL